MTCTHCGKTVDSNKKYCIYCGNPMQQDGQSEVVASKAPSEETAVNEIAAGSEAAQGGSDPQNPTPQQGGNAQPNVYVEQGKKIALDYVEFLKNSLKNPTLIGEKSSKEQQWFGYITMFLISLFIPLILYVKLKQEMGEWMTISFTSFVFKPFLYIVITFAFLSAIIFVVTQLMKVQLKFSDVIGRFGSFLVIPLMIFIAAFILGLISIKISAFLIALGLISVFTAINFTFYSYKNEEGLDPFFGVLLTYIALTIISYILLDELTGSLTSFLF